MTTQLCADDWKEIAAKAHREAAEWRQNFDVLQRALVGDTGASGITAAAALRKDAERYRWLKRNPTWLGWEHDFRPDEVEREIDAAMAGRG